MIVKNEAHLIVECFKHLEKYIKFDYWVINDNGSTDGTQALIKNYFKEKGIPGELDETPWRDFAFNRSKAFEIAYNKTDYAFVWDADDEIYGDFKLPEDLNANHYKFIFGNAMGSRYSRCQLFNNRKRWHYVGVIHEYPASKEEMGPPTDVLGDYYFISGRRGARNKDPEKYLNDALILEKAFFEAFEKKDGIYNRYCFYTAQSYNSCNKHEKAIEFYKRVLTIDNWIEEKYMSCIEIYDQYDKLNRNQEGLFYLIESFKYSSKRIEGIYRLIKYYCINGPVEAAYAYYTMISKYYETQYIHDNVAEHLFAKKDEYDFYLPYYMVIVSQRVDRYDTCIKMLEMIFRQNYLYSGEWWIHNLFHNIQFAISHMPKNIQFLDLILTYVNNLKNNGIFLSPNNYKILDGIIASYRPLLIARGPSLKKKEGPVKIMLSVTTCKRYDLFEQTIHSMLNTWLDIDKVDYFYCVDDNSSEEDRMKMQTLFPFFHYHMKSVKEKGHRESMNIIWNKLDELKPTYWIHMEDDWVYFKRENYITRSIQALEKYENKDIHQLVFNREYGLMMNDMDRLSIAPLEPGLVIHDRRPGIEGANCAYWPHYSLQPSLTRASKILELGNYTSAHAFFERDYAEKYNAKGYKTIFFDSIYSTHIGKQHWETDGKNAYALNEVNQLHGDAESSDTTIEITEINEPLKGSMNDHLDAILTKIKIGTKFGLIRPSDGEYSILKNKSLTNLDSWTFTEGGRLRNDLLLGIQTKNPNLYIGIPCNTCNKPWNCTQAIYDDFINTFNVPLEQRTYANIFGNSNWKIFTKFIKSYEKRFYLITSGDSPSDLPIKERFLIDPLLVNNWDSMAISETERLMKFISNKKDELICFSAGPLSKYWIPLLMKYNPSNTYLDVGASLDIFTKGQTNRLYTNETHEFSKEVCIFNDTKKTKNLIYLGVFFNKQYIELLKLFLLSVKYYSTYDQIDFLILTSEDFTKDIQALSELTGIPLKMKFFSFNSVDEASRSRLYIFDYEEAIIYDKIMYLDTDILVQGDLMNIFREPIEDKIYGMKEGTIEHEIHGGWWFDFTTIDKNTVAMNGGILLFKGSELMKSIFNDIKEHITELKASGKPFPECADQPFVNYHFIKNNKYDNKFMEKYGLIYCIDPPPPPSTKTDVVLAHFVWPIGNASHKLGRMRPHFSHILKYYKELILNSSYPDLVGRGYVWNSGFIRFEPNGLLVTKWTNGRYEYLDNYTVKAEWAGFTHILKFNKSYTSYMSIRIGDLECITGTFYKMTQENLSTYYTKYGDITLLKNEGYIGNEIFDNNIYWDEDTLLKLKAYIDPTKNLLEIGGHCGTSTLIYSSFLNSQSKCYVYEPQKKMYELLVKNTRSQTKIIPYNKAVFCYNGIGNMSSECIDMNQGRVVDNYNNLIPSNFGGLSIGRGGEEVEFVTIDSMDHENIGFIHCDAQGAENFIFSSAIQMITKYKPVIYFENNQEYSKNIYNAVCSKYPDYVQESKFDIVDFCMNTLGYSKRIEKFNNSIDTLLIP